MGGKTTLWRFDMAVNGKASGTLLKVEPSRHDPYKVRVYWRPEGLKPEKEWIENIPEKALVWIDDSILPGLGTNRICILTANGHGESPVGKHLKLISGEISLQLALSKEREASALASKNVEVLERQKTSEQIVDKALETQKKIEGASKSAFWKRKESEDLLR